MELGGRAVGYGFAAIGALLIVFAVYLYRADSQLMSQGVEAQGTVVGFRESTATRRPSERSGNAPEKVEHYEEPIVRFKTADGRVVEFVALRGSFPEDVDKGDSVGVVYLPSDPHGAEVKGSTRLSDGVWMVGILAAGSFVPALFLVVFPALQQRRRRAKLARSPLRKQRIEADVVEVRQLRRGAGGRHTFEVSAQWRNPATGKLHRFDSGRMAFEPAVYASVMKLAGWEAPRDDMVRQALGSARLMVRVHPDDPSHYDAELLRIPGIAPIDS